MRCTLLLLKRWNMVFVVGKTCRHDQCNEMRLRLQTKVKLHQFSLRIAMKGAIRTVYCYQDYSALVLKVDVSYIWLALKRRLVHSVT